MVTLPWMVPKKTDLPIYPMEKVSSIGDFAASSMTPKITYHGEMKGGKTKRGLREG